MADPESRIVICGAGIAGISAAYYLAVGCGARDVILVDERPPLSLTSDKSTECYRNWWPGPGDAMVRLMNRSIDLMEGLARETGNAFCLSRRGYLFVTADPARIPTFERAAAEPSSLGAGSLRIHAGPASRPGQRDAQPYVAAPPQGFEDLPTGADLLLDPELIHRHFPYLSSEAIAALHTRRCGRLSAQQLGMVLLERARGAGVRFLTARLEGVDVADGRVRAVHLSGVSGSQTLPADVLVNAAGPLARQVGSMIGVDLPILCELHAKIAFNDSLAVVPHTAPLCYWADPQLLPWSDDERGMLAESAETRWLLEPFPPGPHLIPEGSAGSLIQLVLWTYGVKTMDPVMPLPPIDPHYFEVVLRGLSRLFPGFRQYFDRLPRPSVDGGYYAKTRENRPLVGPLSVRGAYVVAALSGFGIMAACAAGELLACHVAGRPLPDYAPWFLLERYQDAAYLKLLEEWDSSGQL